MCTDTAIQASDLSTITIVNQSSKFITTLNMRPKILNIQLIRKVSNLQHLCFFRNNPLNISSHTANDFIENKRFPVFVLFFSETIAFAFE